MTQMTVLSETKTHQINEIDWGIAFTTGTGNIYINKNLKEHDPELYKKVLEHEMSHNPGAYDIHDLQEDLDVDFFPLSEKIKFCMRYPKGWMYLSPIAITEKEIAISWLSICKLGVVISIIFFILSWVI